MFTFKMVIIDLVTVTGYDGYRLELSLSNLPALVRLLVDHSDKIMISQTQAQADMTALLSSTPPYGPDHDDRLFFIKPHQQLFAACGGALVTTLFSQYHHHYNLTLLLLLLPVLLLYHHDLLLLLQFEVMVQLLNYQTHF